MTFDLRGVGHDGYISFTNRAWGQLLRLAEEFNWVSVGTTHAEMVDWCGRYDLNDGQVVSFEDAVNLADAVERALEVLPRERTAPSFIVYMEIDGEVSDTQREYEIKSANRRYEEVGNPERLGNDALVLTQKEYEQSDQIPDILLVDWYKDDIWEPDPVDEFSGEEWRKKLLEFIGFCRQGAFTIR